jgi:1,2-phenylacetyl-CoA epoxidase catalytic subunit
MKLSRDASYVSRSIQWGELRGMHKIESINQMTPEYRDTIFKVVYALASTEFASVEQHQPWINRGPTAEDRFTQAQVCADEAHQGMEDLRTLALFGPEGEEAGQRLLSAKIGDHLLEAFNLRFESWTDLCMFCCTMDLVAWYHLKALENSSFAPFARSMTCMIPEERFHASFGANRIRTILTDPEYAERAGMLPGEVQARLEKWYPRALDTFGKKESRFGEAAVAMGIRKWDNEALRQMWLADINPTLERLGLKVPPPEWDRHYL